MPKAGKKYIKMAEDWETVSTQNDDSYVEVTSQGEMKSPEFTTKKLSKVSNQLNIPKPKYKRKSVIIESVKYPFSYPMFEYNSIKFRFTIDKHDDIPVLYMRESKFAKWDMCDLSSDISMELSKLIDDNTPERNQSPDITNKPSMSITHLGKTKCESFIKNLIGKSRLIYTTNNQQETQKVYYNRFKESDEARATRVERRRSQASFQPDYHMFAMSDLNDENTVHIIMDKWSTDYTFKRVPGLLNTIIYTCVETRYFAKPI
jgi:hypothetical protein